MEKCLIREITATDLDEVARIHIASFNDRALSQLGKSAVKKYYRWLWNHYRESYLICAVTQTGAMAGFCFAGNFGGSYSGFIRSHKWTLLLSLLLRPWLIFNSVLREQVLLAIKTQHFFKRKKRSKPQKANPATKPLEKNRSRPAFGILSIAVNPTYQRQGIGELLMNAVELWALKHGYLELNLSVHEDNISAVRFYEKLGWLKTPEGELWRGKMVKKLLP